MAASKPTFQLSLKPHLLHPLSTGLGTLADSPGCFPLDREPYRPRTNCQDTVTGIRSLVGMGRLEAPQTHSVALPPVTNLLDAKPKLVSGRTSYLQV